MRRVNLTILGLVVATCSCVALPVSDLDASTDGSVGTPVTVSSTGGSTSNSILGTGGAQAGGASGTGDSTNDCTETFTACGGDPTGTWDIVNVCVQGDLAAAANASYTADSTECSSLCTRAQLAAQGSVTYGSGSFQPNAVLSLTETLAMTTGCYAALTGDTWSSTSCVSFAQGLDQQSGTTATCTSENSMCDCTYVTVLSSTADTYSVNGSLLVASDGTTTEFCVQNSTMTQRDSFGSNTFAVTQFRKR
jgi:hypothetical protein